MPAGFLEHFQSEQELHANCKEMLDYLPHRRWLLRNGLSLKGLPEEDRFKALNRQFGLETQAIQVHLTNCLRAAVERRAEEETLRRRCERKRRAMRKLRNHLQKKLQGPNLSVVEEESSESDEPLERKAIRDSLMAYAQKQLGGFEPRNEIKAVMKTSLDQKKCLQTL